MINKISNANVLMNSFYEAKKGCSWKNSVQQYEANFLKNIRHTQLELREKTYRQQDFYCFYLKERGKDRYVRSISFYDRVVQRALCDLVNPIVEPYLIHDNGASVKKKGIDFARRRIENHLHKYYRKYGNKGYALVIDFSKFYDNILHKPLMDMYREIIDDKDIINLINHLVDSFSVDISNYNITENELFDSLAYAKAETEKTGEKMMHKSLGIGSQISQISGIYYPSKMDNYCKIVKGIKFYGRYMDDTYIIGNSKEELKSLLDDIDKICKKQGIFINHKKTQLFRLDKGFTFLKIKYRLTDTGHLVRIPVKKNFIRERRKLKSFKNLLDKGLIDFHDIEEQYKSWKGNIQKYDCYKSLKNLDKVFNDLFLNNNSQNSH
jgi:RNA-directed DNA polymerase|nr:MAG TPA: hypothetical protein [Caudoviricetes sp.]